MRRRPKTARPRRRRNPETARVDPSEVNGLRLWIKRTFVPKDHYASASKAIGHLRHLRDVDLNRLWEHLFYAKGLLPRREGQGNSVFERLRLKIEADLNDARNVLENAIASARFPIDAITPGTRDYEYRPDVREHYEKAPGGAAEAVRRVASAEADEAIAKTEAILSGKMLRSISAFLSKHTPSHPYEPDAILLEYDLGRAKLIYTALAEWEMIEMGINPPPKMRWKANRDPRGLDEYIPHFRRAKALLERHGFGDVWYGPMFVSCVKCGGSNRLGANWGVGAHYTIAKDTISVFNDPSDGITQLLIHELGHRYYFKFMSRADRARFDSYFGDVRAVSDYGSTDPWEDFAEVFAHYVTGRDITRAQADRFKAFLAKKDRRRLNPSRPTRRVVPRRKVARRPRKRTRP